MINVIPIVSVLPAIDHDFQCLKYWWSSWCVYSHASLHFVSAIFEINHYFNYCPSKLDNIVKADKRNTKNAGGNHLIKVLFHVRDSKRSGLGNVVTDPITLAFLFLLETVLINFTHCLCCLPSHVKWKNDHLVCFMDWDPIQQCNEYTWTWNSKWRHSLTTR